MDPDELRRWVASRRAVEEREREEQRSNGPNSELSFRHALALVALTGRLHGWPVPEDEVTRREDEKARDSWSRVRAAYRPPPA
jgi:hypothetical protein